MGYVATDIATVPSVNGAGEPFNWYVFLLPGPLDNQIRGELIDNFLRLSRLVGRENMVVLGQNIDEFHTEVILRYALYLQGYDLKSIPLPSLLVTDTVPAGVQVVNGDINAKVILFPLGQAYLRDGMLSNFLRQLCTTLQDHEAFDDIEDLEEKTVVEKWGWIPRYFAFKPKFFGFEVNFNAMLEDLMRGLQE